MKTISFFCGLLLAIHVSISCAAQPVQLFNGRDLSGWSFDMQDDAKPEEVWSVQDGVLICNGSKTGLIRTEKSYGDYELVLEWRWAPGTPGGNSGLLVHCSTPRQLDIWPKCLEVQLMKENAGDFWTLGETIKVNESQQDSNDQRHLWNLTNDSEKPLGEWNTMRVRCKGDSVTVWVNGDKVNEGSGCTANEGAIALQSEGAPIHFRKVELTPMD